MGIKIIDVKVVDEDFIKEMLRDETELEFLTKISSAYKRASNKISWSESTINLIENKIKQLKDVEDSK